MNAVSVKRKTTNATLVDFGKETFGFVKLHNLKGNGKISLYYGESKEEAFSETDAMTLDRLSYQSNLHKTDSVMALSKAFRYVNIVKERKCFFDSDVSHVV